MRISAGIKIILMTLLLFGVGTSFAQAEASSGNSALDQYYEQVPSPDGNGPINGNDGPGSPPDQALVNQLTKRFGDDGASVAAIAYMMGPSAESTSDAGESDGSSNGVTKVEGTRQESSVDGMGVSGKPVVAASVSPSVSGVGEFGVAGLLILVLAIGTLGLLAITVRNRPHHDRNR